LCLSGEGSRGYAKATREEMSEPAAIHDHGEFGSMCDPKCDAYIDNQLQNRAAL